MTIRVLLADDNATFMAAVRQFLTTLPGAQVVGAAHNGRETMELALALEPDLILLDIGMPGMNGLEAAGRMQKWEHPPFIVFLSMHNGQAYREAAREAGAAGFINKGDFAEELPRLIDKLADHQRQATA